MTSALRLVLAAPIEEPTPCPSWCPGGHYPDEPHTRGITRDDRSYIGRSEYNGRTDVFACGYGSALGVETTYTLGEAARFGRGLLAAVALGHVRAVTAKSRRSAIR